MDIFAEYRNNNNESSNEQTEKELLEAMKSMNEDMSHVSLLVFLLLVALGWWSLDDADADSGNLTRINDTEKEQIDALVKEGIAFMNSRKWNLALEAFSAAIVVDPTNVVAHTFKAACHIETGDYHDAILECDIAQRNDTGVLMPRIQFFKGIALALLGKHRDAIECFTITVMKNAHEFPNAFTWIAKSFCAIDNYGAAYGAIMKGLRYTRDAKLLRLQAMLQTKLGRYDEAVQVLDAVLAEQPKDILALITKGIALFGKDDTEGAQKCFDKAISIYPKCTMSLLKKVYAVDPVEMEVPKDFMCMELRELCG